MKTKFVLLAVVLSLNSFASTSPEIQPSGKVFSVNNFGSLNAHRQHNSAALSWTFNSPDVSTFIIYRSYDGENFGQIDQRGPGNGHWNKYVDATVEPGVIFYKVVAVSSNGFREESPVAQLRIVKHG